jgi:hypothetical protein
MMQTWSNWRRFPDVKDGDGVEAPAGPGVYEVRHTLTGRVMAFGHARDVAKTIADLKFDGEIGPIAKLFRRPPLVSRLSDLEYRTCAAASRADAKTAARRLLGLRQNAWRRRLEQGWAVRHPG